MTKEEKAAAKAAKAAKAEEKAAKGGEALGSTGVDEPVDEPQEVIPEKSFVPTGRFENVQVKGGYRVFGPEGQNISPVLEDRSAAQKIAEDQNMYLRKTNSFKERVKIDIE